jgi:hypothetical protein
MALAELCGAVCEEADERPVDVAEAEEAEVVVADGRFSRELVDTSVKVPTLTSQNALR